MSEMSETDKLVASVAARLNTFINPPKEQIQKPKNRLWIALIAFNLIFLPLDIATGATVGYITRWYYGIFVFAAGFGTMVVHEALFSNPFAGTWQKVISVSGFLLSVATTAIIGVAAIAINILVVGYDAELYGAVMAGAAFLVLFLHGILLVVYYFIDHSINAKQKATKTMADHESTLKDFAYSEQIVDKMNALEQRLIKRIESGDGARMGAALQNITGQEWVPSQPQMRSFAADTEAQKFAPK